MTGSVSYLKGLASEAQVAQRYERAGAALLAQRWKARSGEIDLIFSEGDTLIFVEVKCSKTIGRALESVRPRQVRRIIASAEVFAACAGKGALQDVRFDVAAVDAQGQIEIVENAFAA
ncbi:MAG: YraN family protein [Pseudomonadota bacterium]